MLRGGWWRLPLEPELRSKLSDDWRDLRLLDAAGDEVPYWVEDALPAAAAAEPPPQRPLDASLVDVSQAADGWLITLDLGKAPARHNRLRFGFTSSNTVAEVHLETSADGATWQPLTDASLFRLGPGGPEQTEIHYAPTGVRYLRLAWPKAAGFPSTDRVQVMPAPPEAVGTAAITATVAGGAEDWLLRADDCLRRRPGVCYVRPRRPAPRHTWFRCKMVQGGDGGLPPVGGQRPDLEHPGRGNR